MHKLKNIALVIFSSIMIIVVVVILFRSPISKYLISKYAWKYTGRRITIDAVYINPVTGSILLGNLKIYELRSDSIFFSVEGISAKIAMLKLLSKTYEISQLTLYHPKGTIIQNGKDFNFNDLIHKNSVKDNPDTTRAPVHFSILKFKTNNGEFYYREQVIPINYFIKNVNIESSGKRWDTDTINAQFSLLPGIGSGDMKGDFTINLKNSDYRIALVTNKFDLSIIEQYLKDLTNHGSFSANIDANVKAKGNLNDQENISASGNMTINEFHLGKKPKDDLAAFDKLVVNITELDPKNLKYLFDTISLSHPFFKYELYDYLDNLQTMFGKNGANIEKVNANAGSFNLIIAMARWVKVLANSFFRSNYNISCLRISKGDIKFNDFSLSERFALELNPLTVIADSINKDNNRVKVTIKSIIKPYGNISADLSINSKDSSDFDMQYHFQKLAVSMFNPYIISYTSFPLDRGTLEFNGTWHVRKGLIKSTNHLVIIDPRVTKRLRNKDTKWIPVPLIMTFVRERGNVIDYEIPITGDLKNPKFHLYNVFFDLFKNIFIKPPTTPYRFLVKNTETEIEKSITLNWETRHAKLLPAQEKFIGEMTDFLLKNPDASINVYPQQYAIKEKEYILFFEAKKKYYMAMNNKDAGSFGAEDSAKVDNMSAKDSLFVRYLNNRINDSLIFTIQEKCFSIIDSAFINTKFNHLIKERENSFISLFKKREVDKRVKFLKGENVVPYNGFSFYKIEYRGEFPAPLLKAYQKMNELNNEAPRKKFMQERKSINKISLK